MRRTRKPKRRRFQITMTFDVELGEDLIERGLSEEFASYVYRLASAPDVACHLAYNLVQHYAAEDLDGFADRKDWIAELDWKSVELEAIEWIGPPKRRPEPRRKPHI